MTPHSTTDFSFEFSFPAIRGIQAQREYYTTMVPLRLLPRIFVFNEPSGVPPEVRAQRALNKGRLPEMTRYIAENPDSYVFSAITASIDGKTRFVCLGKGTTESRRVGILQIEMGARLLINDGQHRRAAIEHALAVRQALGDETIAVVFYLDQGLKRCQQMFADLNRHAIRPATSLSVLYDHRDLRSEIVRRVTQGTAIFSGLIERERSTLSARSSMLFTLSSVHYATRELLRDQPGTAESLSELAIRYWDAVGQRIRDWQAVQAGTLAASLVRAERLHSHAVVLQALGRVGRVLIAVDPQNWEKRLDRLIGIDWSRRNIQWEGRTLIGGRVSKADAHVALTVNLIKNRLGLQLTKDEEHAEKAFLAARREQTHG